MDDHAESVARHRRQAKSLMVGSNIVLVIGLLSMIGTVAAFIGGGPADGLMSLGLSLVLFAIAGLLWWYALTVAGLRTYTMAQRRSRWRSEAYGLLIIGPGVAAILRRLDVSLIIWLPTLLVLLAVAGLNVVRVRKAWRVGDALVLYRGAGYCVAIVAAVEGAADEQILELRIFPEVAATQPSTVSLDVLIGQQRTGQVRSDRIQAHTLNDFNSKRLAFAHQIPAELGGLAAA